MILFHKKRDATTYLISLNERRELPFLTVVFLVSSKADSPCTKLKNWLQRILYLPSCVKTDPVSFNLRRL